MSDIRYCHQDLVWCKCGGLFWPGQVKALKSLPEEIRNGFLRMPRVVVKFFDEEGYEFVEDDNKIYPYQCGKKEEFIKKGLARTRCKAKEGATGGWFAKFPKDVIHCEKLMGGDENILQKKPFTENKTKVDYSKIFGDGASLKRNSGKGNKSISGKKGSKRKLEQELVSSTSNISGKKNTHVESKQKSSIDKRIINSDYQMRILTQPSTTHHIDMKGDKEKQTSTSSYNCQFCSFSTTRLNVFIFHNKSHSKPAKHNIPIQSISLENNPLGGIHTQITKNKHQKSSLHKIHVLQKLKSKKYFTRKPRMSKKKKELFMQQTKDEKNKKLLGDWSENENEEEEEKKKNTESIDIEDIFSNKALISIKDTHDSEYDTQPVSLVLDKSKYCSDFSDSIEDTDISLSAKSSKNKVIKRSISSSGNGTNSAIDVVSCLIRSKLHPNKTYIANKKVTKTNKTTAKISKFQIDTTKSIQSPINSKKIKIEQVNKEFGAEEKNNFDSIDDIWKSCSVKPAKKTRIIRMSDHHSIQIPARPHQNAQLIRHGNKSGLETITAKILAKKEERQRIKSIESINSSQDETTDFIRTEQQQKIEIWKSEKHYDNSPEQNGILEKTDYKKPTNISGWDTSNNIAKFSAYNNRVLQVPTDQQYQISETNKVKWEPYYPLGQQDHIDKQIPPMWSDNILAPTQIQHKMAIVSGLSDQGQLQDDLQDLKKGDIIFHDKVKVSRRYIDRLNIKNEIIQNPDDLVESLGVSQIKLKDPALSQDIVVMPSKFQHQIFAPVGLKNQVIVSGEQQIPVAVSTKLHNMVPTSVTSEELVIDSASDEQKEKAKQQEQVAMEDKAQSKLVNSINVKKQAAIFTGTVSDLTKKQPLLELSSSLQNNAHFPSKIQTQLIAPVGLNNTFVDSADTMDSSPKLQVKIELNAGLQYLPKPLDTIIVCPEHQDCIKNPDQLQDEVMRDPNKQKNIVRDIDTLEATVIFPSEEIYSEVVPFKDKIKNNINPVSIQDTMSVPIELQKIMDIPIENKGAVAISLGISVSEQGQDKKVLSTKFINSAVISNDSHDMVSVSFRPQDVNNTVNPVAKSTDEVTISTGLQNPETVSNILQNPDAIPHGIQDTTAITNVPKNTAAISNTLLHKVETLNVLQEIVPNSNSPENTIGHELQSIVGCSTGLQNMITNSIREQPPITVSTVSTVSTGSQAIGAIAKNDLADAHILAVSPLRDMQHFILDQQLLNRDGDTIFLLVDDSESNGTLDNQILYIDPNELAAASGGGILQIQEGTANNLGLLELQDQSTGIPLTHTSSSGSMLDILPGLIHCNKNTINKGSSSEREQIILQNTMAKEAASFQKGLANVVLMPESIEPSMTSQSKEMVTLEQCRVAESRASLVALADTSGGVATLPAHPTSTSLSAVPLISTPSQQTPIMTPATDLTQNEDLPSS